MEQDRQLRDRFEAIDEIALERLVEEKAQESTGLEFKSWGKDEHNKTNLAKVISGFANGEGGICIWGIRESSSGAPRSAESLAPIEDAARALDRLNDWTADATSPRHPNVHHEVIAGKFVKTLVLATDGQPVMARFGIDQYRVRVATRNMAMEHFQIADMFGRRARPRLSILHVVGRAGKVNGCEKLVIRLHVHNDGRGAATHMQVALIPRFAPNQFVGILSWRLHGKTVFREIADVDGFGGTLISDEPKPLHVGVSTPIAQIVTQPLTLDARGELQLRIETVCLCAEAPPRVDSIVLDTHHLRPWIE